MNKSSTGATRCEIVTPRPKAYTLQLGVDPNRPLVLSYGFGGCWPKPDPADEFWAIIVPDRDRRLIAFGKPTMFYG